MFNSNKKVNNFFLNYLDILYKMSLDYKSKKINHIQFGKTIIYNKF